MNHYEFFLSKLKAMQLQGFSRSQILDEWSIGLGDVIEYLNKQLAVGVLTENVDEILKIRKQINHIKELDNTIKKGLLE
jgi:hypothetical protein